MHVTVRCNAGGRTGLGHLSRCLNLAGVLATRGARCTFLVPSDALPLIERIRANGHGATPIDASSREHDLSAIHHHCLRTPCDWLLVDHYDADSRYLAAAAKCAPALAVLDDLGDRDLSCARLVVNPSPDAVPATHLGTTTTLLDGPRHALLAPAFAERRAQFSVRDEVEHIAVYLGGALTDRLWTHVHAAIRTHHPDAHLTLVAAPGTALTSRLHSDPVDLRTGLSPSELAALFARADLAVTPPSTAAWEACCIGIPTAFVPTADNQRHVASFLDTTLGTVTRLEHLAATLARISPLEARRALSTRVRAVTDGLGAARVADAMMRPDRCASPG